MDQIVTAYNNGQISADEALQLLACPQTRQQGVSQYPDGPVWRAYWNGTALGGTLRDGPVVRTVGECVQAVLWSGTIGLAPLTPLGHAWPPGLTVVRLADMTPSRLVVAWNKADANPLIRSPIQIATAVYRSRPAG